MINFLLLCLCVVTQVFCCRMIVQYTKALRPEDVVTDKKAKSEGAPQKITEDLSQFPARLPDAAGDKVPNLVTSFATPASVDEPVDNQIPADSAEEVRQKVSEGSPSVDLEAAAQLGFPAGEGTPLPAPLLVVPVSLNEFVGRPGVIDARPRPPQQTPWHCCQPSDVDASEQSVTKMTFLL